MKKDKVINRIKKLLAMAGDVSSPNEAAIAASRARKLMDEYQISLDDLQESDGFGVTSTNKSYTYRPKWMSILAPAVAKFNDTQALGAEGRIVFRGFETDVFLSLSMYEYLVKTITRLCKEYMRECGYSHYHASVGDPFKYNAAKAVCEKIRELIKERKTVQTSTGKDLVIIKKDLVEQKFGAVKYVKSKKEDTRFSFNPHIANAAMAGYEAGKRIPLNTQVKGSKDSKLLS